VDLLGDLLASQALGLDGFVEPGLGGVQRVLPQKAVEDGGEPGELFRGARAFLT
jgi:hypothetical protein